MFFFNATELLPGNNTAPLSGRTKPKLQSLTSSPRIVVEQMCAVALLGQNSPQSCPRPAATLLHCTATHCLLQGGASMEVDGQGQL